MTGKLVYVMWNGQLHAEKRGIMAQTPPRAGRNFIARSEVRAPSPGAVWARAAWAALSSLCVFGWCFVVVDEASGHSSDLTIRAPFSAVSDLMSFANNNVTKRDEPIDPQRCPPFCNCRDLTRSQFDIDVPQADGRSLAIRWEKSARTIREEVPIIRDFGKLVGNNPFNALCNSFCGGAAVVLKIERESGNHRRSLILANARLWWNALDLCEAKLIDNDEWQFGADCGYGVKIGGFSSDPCGLVGAKQKADLSQRNCGKQCSEDAQNKSIKGDRVVPRSLPDYRKPLPEGFGYLMLIAAGIGAVLGFLYVSILWWCLGRNDRPKARRQ